MPKLAWRKILTQKAGSLIGDFRDGSSHAIPRSGGGSHFHLGT